LCCTAQTKRINDAGSKKADLLEKLPMIEEQSSAASEQVLWAEQWGW
jgi:hypothetical protein